MDIDVSQSGNVFAYSGSNPASRRYSEENRQNTDDSFASKQSETKINIADFTKVDGEQADKASRAEQQDLDTAVADVADFIQAQNRQLDFSFDENSNKSIIKVTDSESGEIIRQIPSEEMLKLAERINELRSDAGEAIGVLVNRQV
ncbi:flagellar protein FlaG [Catenovulum sediminis]|uniref:Flagellar protein FlaG n=1 Tax=Catenovulum sediminis TaxID=1740262 RepID=A0ABV1RGS7_9ALTE|nr:flagellar protein FlaG [Catenovulum sediminis]